jgi:RNA polymerase sigma-70 factor (ECF subfamily)
LGDEVAPNGPSERRHADDSPLVRAFFEKRDALVLFLAARTRSMEQAEDLVQDLYLKIAALEPGADVRSPGPLLYRMAANLMVDQARSAQRSSRRNAQWRLDNRTIVAGQDVMGEPAADEAIIGRERVRQLADAVAALPPQMQRAFRLCKLEGKSQAEAADLMGVSRKTIEHHMQAAVRQLAARLRP